MNLSNYFKDKGIGFWFSAVSAILLLISGILFMVIVPGIDKFIEMAAKWEISAGVVTGVGVIAILGAVASIVLIGFKQYKYIGYTQFGFALVSFLGFVYASSKYIFEVFMDIEIHGFATSFVIIMVLFVITLIVAIANVFLKQTKKVELNEEVDHE